MDARGAAAAVCLVGLAACGGAPSVERHAPATTAPLVVSAAMSLRHVMVDIGRAHEAAGHGRVAFNFGGSNSLARQIVEGAPVDLFVSADQAQMDAVDAAGAIARGTRVDLLSNQLVVIVPADRPARLSSVRDLAGPAFARLAVGDPDAVPVGVYAKGYLDSLGLWGPLRPKVLPVTSVRAALGAVENGGADAAFVYRTDAALSSKVVVAFVVPLDEGPPIRYAAAVTRATKQPGAARAFLDFLRGADARALFERSGFVVLAGRKSSAPGSR